MNRYAVTYSYPTVDPHYRGQHTLGVSALTEQDARAKVLREAPQGSTIVRIKLSRASLL